MGIDVSSLKVNFESCKSCSASSRYSQYNNNYGNNNQGQQYNYYNQNQNYDQYQTPLCSGAYYYKDNCNGSCRRQAKRAASGKKNSYGGGGYSEGFSPLGKFFLWVLSISGMYYLLIKLEKLLSVLIEEFFLTIIILCK